MQKAAKNRRCKIRAGGKAILTGMALSLILFSGSAKAEEPNGINMTEEEITWMDEDCNLLLFDDEESPVVEEGEAGISAYAESIKVVNFRATSSGTALASSQTTEYKEKDTNYDGYTCGAYGADAAYLGTENGKVKFLLSGVIGLVDASKVQVIDYSSAKSISCYYANGTNLYHKIATNLNSTAYGSTLNLGPQPSYLSAGGTYYSYDGHYFYTDYATMISDYQNNNRNHAVNASQPYFNYYQYLPLRSESNYSASELNALIQSKTGGSGKLVNTGSYLADMQNKYGVNALAILAVAGNESAWGKSNIALNKNNLFGLNAVDASPSQSANTYSSVEACIKDYAETYMSKRYLRAGYQYYKGGFLGNKASGINVSYGSDPYWGEKAAAIMWNLDSANKDRYKYTLGINDLMSHNHTDLNIRKEASASSAKLYSTGLQSACSFIILDTSGDFYRVQSDPVLNSGRTAIDTSTGSYHFGSMYAYASKGYITVVSGEADDGKFSVCYSPHVQTYGWQSYQKNGATAGTEGQAKRLEAIKIYLSNAPYSGSVTYQTHVQTYGWLDSVSDGAMSGTEGQAKRLEAIRISLTGELANHYDIYYRVHAQTYGWMGWAKNGESAGSAGYAKRLEAIQIVLVEKGGAAPGSTENAFRDASGGTSGTPHVQYRTHIQTYGWQSFVKDGASSGTTGQAKRLESIMVSLTDKPVDGSVQYRTHIQTYGWQNWVSEGSKSGTEGQAKRLEAIQIRLTGNLANQYDIYYRVHCQTYGWLGWAKNGEYAGTEGLAKRLEAIQIVLVKKGGAAPGSTGNTFIKK